MYGIVSPMGCPFQQMRPFMNLLATRGTFSTGEQSSSAGDVSTHDLKPEVGERGPSSRGRLSPGQSQLGSEVAA